jgi:hypothetical protein
MTTLSAKQIGKFDKGGRYYIDDAYRTDSSRAVRTPSRAWPYSEYKHVFIKKYAKQLAEKLGLETLEIVA